MNNTCTQLDFHKDAAVQTVRTLSIQQEEKEECEDDFLERWRERYGEDVLEEGCERMYL